MKIWAVVVVKWSTFSPSTPSIRVRIPLKSTVLFCTSVFQKSENKQKEAVDGPIFFKKTIE